MQTTAIRALRAELPLGLAALRRANASCARHLVRTPFPAITSSRFAVRSLVTGSSVRAQAYVHDAVPELDDEVDLLSDKGATLPPITSEYASLKPYLNYDTWKALTSKPFNFTEMSEVQKQVLSLLPALADPFLGDMPDGKGGRDLLVKAKTGTGKTIGFLTPAIERRLRGIHHAERGRFTEPWKEMLAKQRPDLDFASLDKLGRQKLRRQFCYNTAGALIISPTRELATQIATEAKKLCTYHRDLNVHTLVGGSSRNAQAREWNRGRPDIVVATPGRLLDFLREDSMFRDPLSAVQTLIYDEADTLLDMGFRDDIEEILTYLPRANKRSTMLFSATVSPEIRQIAAQSLLPDHRFIDCVPAGEDNLHKHVPQRYTVVEDAGDQMAHLTRLIALDQLRNPGKSKVIVFSATKAGTMLFSNFFNRRSDLLASLPAGQATGVYELHSQLDSNKRFRVSDMFRQDARGASILFTSDVSARGVDYPGTTQVIQIGIPTSSDMYVHRVGRTGRAGKAGRADLLIQPFEIEFIRSDLHGLPVTDVSVEAVQKEVESFAKRFDEEPSDVVPADVLSKMQAPGGSRSRSGRSPLVPFERDVEDRLAGVPQIVKQEAQSVDSEMVEKVYMSYLGYYAARSKALRVPIATINDSLKQWAVAAGDLERPPYVSQQFLDRLGHGYQERKPARRAESPRSEYSSRFSRGGKGYGGGGFGGRRGARNGPGGYSSGRRQSAQSDRF